MREPLVEELAHTPPSLRSVILSPVQTRAWLTLWLSLSCAVAGDRVETLVPCQWLVVGRHLQHDISSEIQNGDKKITFTWRETTIGRQSIIPPQWQSNELSVDDFLRWQRAVNWSFIKEELRPVPLHISMHCAHIIQNLYFPQTSPGSYDQKNCWYIHLLSKWSFCLVCLQKKTSICLTRGKDSSRISFSNRNSHKLQNKW